MLATPREPKEEGDRWGRLDFSNLASDASEVKPMHLEDIQGRVQWGEWPNSEGNLKVCG